MKLLTTKQNIVILKLADDVAVDVTADKVILTTTHPGLDENSTMEQVGHLNHLNSGNTILVENVTAELPSEYHSHKFKYENNKFTVVPGWKDPEVAQ